MCSENVSIYYAWETKWRRHSNAKGQREVGETLETREGPVFQTSEYVFHFKVTGEFYWLIGLEYREQDKGQEAN